MRDQHCSIGIVVLLTSVFSLTACVENGSSREEAKTSKSRVDSTRELLQSLRSEVVELLKSLDAESDSDGMPLLRKEGKLFYWGPSAELPVEGIAWVLDAWGRPIVLVESEDDPADWCLISAGPDGLWTSDGLMSVAPETDKQAFVERAPHYYGAEDSVHRRVLGDDVVLHSTGLFFKPYEHPVPAAQNAIASLLRILTDGAHGGGIPAAPDLLDELSETTPAERKLAADFVKEHQAGFSFCEDTWSHECPRKDGLLPDLFLCHPKLFESRQPPFWIQPEEDGWVLDWNLDNLLEEADPGREKKQEPLQEQ